MAVAGAKDDGLLLGAAGGEEVPEQVPAHLGDSLGEEQSLLEGGGVVASPGRDPSDWLSGVGVPERLALEVFLIEPGFPLGLRLVVEDDVSRTISHAARQPSSMPWLMSYSYTGSPKWARLTAETFASAWASLVCSVISVVRGVAVSSRLRLHERHPPLRRGVQSRRFTPPRREPLTPGPTTPATPPERTIEVEGFDVRVSDAGRYVVTMVDGRAMPVTVDEYKQRVAERLVAEVPTIERFRARWIAPPERRDLLGRLPDAGRSALLVRALEDMTDYDLYDVLAELGFGAAPRTREHRAEAFAYKHAGWLAGLPAPGAATLSALARQFARAGTDGLESPEVFRTPEVARAGGVRALRALGNPAAILREAKERLFAA